MPLFEYKCDKCDYRFDKMVLRHDETVKCPLCTGEVQKLMSVFSVGASDKTAGMPINPGCTNC